MRIAMLLTSCLVGCSQARPVDSGTLPGRVHDTGSDTRGGNESGIPTDTGTPPPLPADVLINELLPNQGGGGPDWIELHNVGQSIADLTGWTLSDRPDQPWSFPEATQLRPGAFLLIYADDGAGAETDGLHATFKLSQEGETLTLASPDETMGDRVIFPALSSDEAYARTPDGSASWTVVPGGGTPAAPNQAP
ncbi:MAG: lamin tail domain-containing protein [Myxococcota bacterium]|nr:lamin tail domain-containing protein [Myxococcota bacterium]MEC8424722.1 lamin tail domain-containing protein [Myxococcota bacterium]